MAVPGGCGVFRFGDGVEPFVNGSGILRAGETVEIITPGAGGYGAPSERDPVAVERDLADQRVHLAAANIFTLPNCCDHLRKSGYVAFRSHIGEMLVCRSHLRTRASNTGG
jgi:hypothetical protein